MIDDQEIERLKRELAASNEKLSEAIEDELLGMLWEQCKRANADETLPSTFHFAALNALLRIAARQALAAHLAHQIECTRDRGVEDLSSPAVPLSEEELWAWSDDKTLPILKVLSEATMRAFAELIISEEEA